MAANGTVVNEANVLFFANFYCFETVWFYFLHLLLKMIFFKLYLHWRNVFMAKLGYQLRVLIRFGRIVESMW